ncbi:MAG: hypothetical protein U5L45_04475 [Saprospiraceae bacterium]|nr:hypothetical protein [Saprospiraceae bacterium]
MVVLSIIAACGKNNDTTGSNRLVATVYNRSLYLNDLEGMFPESATHQDSQQVVTAFSDRWIREQVIMSEAERNVPKELNLDELVKKYRESLILSSYEEQLTKIGLDTAITEGELAAFYEKNKEQYQLETPIVRCYFLKVARPTQQIDSLNKWWNSPKSGDNLRKLQVYARQNARNYIFEDSIWTRADDIIAMLPKGTLTADNISTGKELTLKTDDAQYFFRALGVMNKQEIAPLSFIRSQASKYILHRRKTQLLEKKKQEMYDTELRKNNVKIYSY